LSPSEETGPNTEPSYPDVTGVILAGGESKRMGRRNKALMEIGGTPIISRVVDVLGQCLEETIIITNTPGAYEFLNLPMRRDIKPGRGSLGGLYTALISVETQYAFLTACDMPFLNVDVINLMLGMINGADVIIPSVDNYFEPLHAIYSKSCIPVIEELLEKHDLKILNLFPKLKIREVKGEQLRPLAPDLRFLINVNTLSQLDNARALDEES
jgi:molybdopterin-guanine dinucleotide biosynthesis protein A